MLILGAAGRDYHTFNTLFRDGPRQGDTVVCFTHAQIPHIESSCYPPALAGPKYPKGVPIFPEDRVEEVIREMGVTRAILAYSDVSYSQVMSLAARVRAAGAEFELLSGEAGMLPCSKPVVAVTATRTGCGKSQVCKMVVEAARAAGKRIVLVRHPMPYGKLEEQAVQRFETVDDLTKHHTTIEEREEYEQHILNGVVVYAGVDYEAILQEASQEADIVLWDGGNNDTPFYKPDLWICVADPFRPDAQCSYYPGDVNFRRAAIIVVNKANTAPREGVSSVVECATCLNPAAQVICTASEVTVSRPKDVKGKRVVVVEDGPTLTHGGMPTGAGWVAASKYGAAEVVDPRPYFVGEMKATLQKYPHMGPVVPAMGYSDEQISDLVSTLNAVPADIIILGTPSDITRVMKPGALQAPREAVVAVTYGLDPDEQGGGAELKAALDKFFKDK